MQEPLVRAHASRARSIHFATPLLALIVSAALGCQSSASPPAMEPQASPPPPAVAAAVSSPPPLATAPPLPPAPVPATFDVADLAERVQPVVVNITTTSTAAMDGADPLEFFFNNPHAPGHNGQRSPQRGPKRVALGTGFIIDPNGYVVTNEHVVHDSEDVKVKLADEREFKADIVGRDPKLDLALLKLEGASGLPAAQLGSSDKLRVGEHVMAVGNPFGLGHTVTLGIVSAKERALPGGGPYDDFIQTDASINPGNSGGPLFNWRGEVVGINSMIRANANNIGFAIPVDDLKSVLGQLREKGHVDRGKLGLAFQPVSEDLAKALGLSSQKGALVSEVEPNGSAARAGIRPGDVILAVNDQPLAHFDELPRKVAFHAPGTQIKVEVVHNRATREVTATLDELRDDTQIVPASANATKTKAPGPDKNFGVAISETNGNGVRVDDVLDQTSVKDLEPGDVIVDVNGAKISDVASLKRALAAAKPGSVALLKVRRGRTMQFAGVPVPSK